MMCFYVCNFFYYVLPARMSVPTCRGQKKVPHPLELEFSVSVHAAVLRSQRYQIL